MRKIEIEDSFLLMLSVLFFADTDGSLFLFLAAALLHEMGHYCGLRLCGGRFTRLRLTAAGAVMKYRMGEAPSRRSIIALLGPGTSLLVAYVSAHVGAYRFAGANFLLGIFNLLPILPLDGGTVIFWLLRSCPKLVYFISWLTTLFLIGAGLLAVAYGGGAALLLMGCFLLFLQKTCQKHEKDVH